ncbi:MAG TPA: TIGR03663 family protein [Prosthecobacter sp.]|nr:TIGR03663 family protein [Prosthecobacter sp.]
MNPRKETRLSITTFLVLVLGALVLGGFYRLPHLDRRPMHTDEAVLGMKLADYWQSGHFDYDPKDYHGPGLHQVSKLWGMAAGWGDSATWTESDLRLVAALCGMALLLLTLLFADALGRAGTALAMTLTAVSPMMVFYSRYFIMEMLLAMLVALSLGSFWRFSQGGTRLWLVLGGCALGMQHATKETFILNAGAACCGWVAARVLVGGFSPRQNGGLQLGPAKSSTRPASPWLWTAVPAVFVSVAAFSSWFQDWTAVRESVTCYLDYLERGKGSGHQKPWHYYLTLIFWRKDTLVWSEAMIGGLALAGMLHAFFGDHQRKAARQAFLVFLTVYTLALLTVYSLISYKTPWSILCAQHALILLAGAGGGAIWAALPNVMLRGLFHLLVASGLYHLCSQTMRLTGTHANPQLEYSADPRNPYVYSHPPKSLFKLLDLVRSHIGGKTDTARVQVIQKDSGWPLPWYWRAWPLTGWHTAPPDSLDADVIVVEADYYDAVKEKIRAEDYIERSPFGLRPGVIVSVFLRKTPLAESASGTPAPAPPAPGEPLTPGAGGATLTPAGTLSTPPVFSPELPPLPGMPRP